MSAITILFGTEMGTAETCAVQLGEMLDRCNLTSRVVDMADYDHKELPQEGLLFVITSTTGHGDPPSNALELFHHIQHDKPDLSARTFAVLALGDSYYVNFAKCGKDFDRMLEEQGGTRVIDRIDCDADVTEPFKQFKKQVLAYFERELDEYPMFTAEALTPETAGQETKQSSPKETVPKSRLRSILSRVKRRLLRTVMP